VETELLSNHKSRVLDDPDAGTEALLLNWKVDDLTRMFRMFKRVERGLEPMSAIVRNFIKKEGNEINSKFAGGTLESSKYIDACLELHDKYTELFHGSFEDHEAFNKARREAYEVFMNETLTQPTKQEGQPPVKVTVSELLSLYCDNLMKSTSISSDELDAILQKVVALFVYIQDKDLFQEFYRKQMSKRLLMSKTDNDNEKLLISKLKLKMGAPYTSKLEGMIHDKSVSAETQQKFMTWCKTNQTKTLPFDFSAQVLTTGHWPAFKIEALNAPPMFQEALENFRMYYHSTTSSKVLKWVHSLGTVTMSAKFKKGPKEVICTTYQACVLLLFNDREKCNVKTDMCDVLNLPIAEAKRTIVALAYGKFPMLVKEGGGKKVVNETDDFKVNEEFSTPQRKFKIPSVMQTVGDPIEKTDESRRHVTDASIVRIMKARKQMSHAELQAECLRQLGNLFRPDPKLIKKRIEDLIQRAYLERDQDDRNMYRYLA
jgi:cullin 1